MYLEVIFYRSHTRLNLLRAGNCSKIKIYSWENKISLFSISLVRMLIIIHLPASNFTRYTWTKIILGFLNTINFYQEYTELCNNSFQFQIKLTECATCFILENNSQFFLKKYQYPSILNLSCMAHWSNRTHWCCKQLPCPLK